MKRIKRLLHYAWILILWILIIAHLTPPVVIASGALLRLVGLITIPHTYIQKIDVPSYPEAARDLFELNFRGYGNVVKTEGYRPVYIIERELTRKKKEYQTLGMTYSLPGYCIIIMDKSRSYYSRKYVLWHEYLHCFEFMNWNNGWNIFHSPDEKDIMYAYNTLEQDWDSVDKYLERIQKLFK